MKRNHPKRLRLIDMLGMSTREKNDSAVNNNESLVLCLFSDRKQSGMQKVPILQAAAFHHGQCGHNSLLKPVKMVTEKF